MSYYFEGLPTGYLLANFQKSAVNSFWAIVNVKVCQRQTDGWMDRQTDGQTPEGHYIDSLCLHTWANKVVSFSHKPSSFLILAQYILINVLEAVFRNSSGGHFGFWSILKNAQHKQTVPIRILTLHHILNQTVQKKSVYQFLQGGLTWHSDNGSRIALYFFLFLILQVGNLISVRDTKLPD